MKCPIGKAPAEVLETRQKRNSTTYRRYQCFNMHRFSSLETVKIHQENKCVSPMNCKKQTSS